MSFFLLAMNFNEILPKYLAILIIYKSILLWYNSPRSETHGPKAFSQNRRSITVTCLQRNIKLMIWITHNQFRVMLFYFLLLNITSFVKTVLHKIWIKIFDYKDICDILKLITKILYTYRITAVLMKRLIIELRLLTHG